MHTARGDAWQVSSARSSRTCGLQRFDHGCVPVSLPDGGLPRDAIARETGRRSALFAYSVRHWGWLLQLRFAADGFRNESIALHDRVRPFCDSSQTVGPGYGASMDLVPIRTGERDILGEGPVWDATREILWWVDIVAKRLRRYNPSDNRVETWHLPQAAGSLASTHTNHLLLAVEDGFASFEPEIESLVVFVRPEPGLPHNRLNDGKVDRQGRFWAGSMDGRERRATGSLYRIDADLSCHRILNGLHIPNSLAWSPDSKIMYFTETFDRLIFVFDYDADTGTPSNQRVFAEVPAPGYPDGSTVDAAGCLWNAEFNGWRLVRYTPAGDVDRIVQLPVQSPTCCVFGGPNLETLYVTSASRDVPQEGFVDQPDAGRLFVVDVGATGIPENYFAGRF